MSAGDKTPADDDWSLDPDITNEKWAELTAKAEFCDRAIFGQRGP